MKAEEYFKDKIDWKFFNAILDRLTKYEDDVIKCNIEIVVFYPGQLGSFMIIYIYQDGRGYYMNHLITKNDISKYNKYGLIIGFNVHIFDDVEADKFRENFDCKKYGYTLKGNYYDESVYLLPYRKIQ